MDSPLHVCVAQMFVDDQDPSANARRISAFGDELRGDAVDLLVLPELCDVGYDLAKIRERITGNESPALDAIRSVAATLDCLVAAGLVEVEGDQLFNTLSVVAPDGSIAASYRKIKLFAPAGEEEVFGKGDNLVTFKLRDWTVGLAICNDLRFPVMLRDITKKGIDALVLAASWPFPRVRHFTTLAEARAIENRVFVVACNRVGSVGDLVFAGHSRIIDPHGDIVSSVSDSREMIIRASLDRSVLEWVRSRGRTTKTEN